MKLTDALAAIFLVVAAIVIAIPIGQLMREAGVPTI
jgi:hypothetical protein